MMSVIRQRMLPTARTRLSPARAYAAGLVPGRTRPRRFVIVTSGRAGSELLVSLLRSHPTITCDAEMLNRKRISPERMLDGRAARAASRGHKAYGFKLQPHHILDLQQVRDRGGWVRQLHEQGWQVIRLERANRLHQAISVMRATTTQWHYRHGDPGLTEPMALDPNAVIGAMYLIQHRENQIVEMLKDVEHLELSYEDDLQYPDQQSDTVSRICSYLDIDEEPTTTDLMRVTPAAIRDVVSNYDEIADAIRRNSFVEYLAD
jgi:LPS sulfotransferase NodH